MLTSCVGAMFAPHHQRTADELVRVVRLGARIGLLNWTPAITLLPAGRSPTTVRRHLEYAAAIAAMVGAGVSGGVPLPEMRTRLPVLIGATATALVAWRRRGLVLPVAAGLLITGALAAL